MTTEPSARDAALRLLSRRDYAAAELLEALLAQDFEEEDARDAVGWLVEIRYVDDEKYAQGILRRCVSKGYGYARCLDDMHARGVDEAVAARVLEEYPDDAEVAARWVARLRRGALDFRERRRLTGLLLRRGFAPDEIETALYEAAEEE